MQRDDVVAGVDDRLVDLEELADRRLRRARQILHLAKLVVEGVEIGDLEFRDRAVVPDDGEADLGDAVVGDLGSG